MTHKITTTGSLFKSASPADIPKNFLFKPNEILSGKVMQNLKNGEVLISVKGHELRAFSETGLTEGVRYHFLVKSTEGRTVLQVLADETQIHTIQLKFNFNKLEHLKMNVLLSDLTGALKQKALPPDLKKVLASLKQHLTRSTFQGQDKDPVSSLLRHIADNGLSWEKKAALFCLEDLEKPFKKLLKHDLKGLLMALKQKLSSPELKTGPYADLQVKTDQLLQLIEQDQILNLLALRNNMGPLFFIPGFSEDGLLRAEAFLEEQKNDRDQGFDLLLFLEFTNLGLMEIHLNYLDPVLRIKVFVEDSEKVALIQDHAGLLEENLHKIGMRLRSMTCDVKDKEELLAVPRAQRERRGPSLHLVI